MGTRIGGLDLGEAPRVVGTVTDPALLAALAAGAPPGCDVVEVRLDRIGTGAPGWLDGCARLTERGMPVLLTLRHRSEGGSWAGGGEERLALYRRALPWVAAVDAEIGQPDAAAVASAARAAGRDVLLSRHDFAGTPSDAALDEAVRAGRALGADVVKIAALLAGAGDLARLKALLDRHRGADLCLLGMGGLGPVSRVELPLAGSCLTYGFVGEPAAPGQVEVSELQARLRAASAAYARAAPAGRPGHSNRTDTSTGPTGSRPT